MVDANTKKSFKKYASKHLATQIQNRRKGRLAKTEQKARDERRTKRNIKDQEREERGHQKDLSKLKDDDPEFYSFLEEDDPALLQYGQMGEDQEILGEDDGSDAETDVDEEEEEDDEEFEEGSDEDEDEDDENEEERAATKKLVAARVTRTELDETVKGKKVDPCVNLLASAVRALGYKLREEPRPTCTRKFHDQDLPKATIVAVSKAVSAQLPTLLATKDKNITFKTSQGRHSIKRFLSAAVVVLAEGSNDGALCAAVAQSMTAFVRVMHLIHGCTKNVLKAVLQLCSHADEPARVAGYLVAHTIAKRAAGTRSMYQSSVFKGMFLVLIKTAHNYTIHSLPIVGFLMNTVVDLYGTDLEAAYQHCYVYIRQLAVYLRAALQQQSQHNIRTVFNWQFLNALRTWGLVVSSYSEPKQLGPLIHPIVQVGVGLLDLFSSPRMFPMHLHVIEMLNHISARASVYIPIATYILRIITSSSISLDAAAKKSSNDAIVDLQFSMRVKKNQAKSSQYRVALWLEALYLLVHHLSVNSHSIGFPEAFWAVFSTLAKLRREVKMPKVHSLISTILKHCDTTCKTIIAKRDAAAFGPCDTDGVKMFEDDLKLKGSPLTGLYEQMRAARVAEFAAKQKDLKERQTLEQEVEAGEERQTQREDQRRKRTRE